MFAQLIIVATAISLMFIGLIRQHRELDLIDRTRIIEKHEHLQQYSLPKKNYCIRCCCMHKFPDQCNLKKCKKKMKENKAERCIEACFNKQVGD